MGSEDTAQLPVEGIQIFCTPCQEGTLRCRRIWGRHPQYPERRGWAKRPHFTCLESQTGPLGEATEKKLTLPVACGRLCCVRGRFLGCHELPFVP